MIIAIFSTSVTIRLTEKTVAANGASFWGLLTSLKLNATTTGICIGQGEMNEDRLREWPVVLIVHVFFRWLICVATLAINRGNQNQFDAGSSDAASLGCIPLHQRLQSKSTVKDVLQAQTISVDEHSMMDSVSAEAITDSVALWAGAPLGENASILPVSTPNEVKLMLLAIVSTHRYAHPSKSHSHIHS